MASVLDSHLAEIPDLCRRYGVAPLYRTVPEAALRDPVLYELLARVATALGVFRERVTFVGGCVVANQSYPWKLNNSPSAE